MKTTLALGVRGRAGQTGSRGVVAELLPASEVAQSQRFVIPWGDAGEMHELAVEPGHYVVHATLPSGQLLSGSVRVIEGVPASLLLEVASSEAQVRTRGSTRFLLGPPEPWVALADDESVTWEIGRSASSRAWQDWASEPQQQLDPMLDAKVDLDAGCFSIEGSGGPVHVLRREAGLRRRDVLWLPPHWETEREAARFEIRVPDDLESSLALTLGDPRFGTMLGYLASGALPSAAMFIDVQEDATQLLFEKLWNPHAAAAGAYVLIETETDPHERKPWHAWIDNLANWFGDLPDGAVLAGWHRLRNANTPADMEAARPWFELAIARGIPNFTLVFRALVDGLTMFVDEPDIDTGDFAAKLVEIQAVARHLDIRQPFTTLRFGPQPAPR